MLGDLLVNNQWFESIVCKELNYILPVRGSILHYVNEHSFGGFCYFKEERYLIGATYGKGRWLTRDILGQMIQFPFDILQTDEVRARIFKDNKRAMLLSKRYFGTPIQETSSWILYSYTRENLNNALAYGMDSRLLHQYCNK